MLALTLALAVTILAADSEDWGRVKALSKGTNVTVIQSDMKSVRGPVDAASDNEIVIGGTTIAKARVARISSHKTSHRVLNPTGVAARKSRISLPLFLHPRRDIVLSERYTVGSYFAERMRELSRKA